MTKLGYRATYVILLLVALPAGVGAQRPAEAVRQEREQAAREVPQLAALLALQPGMTVADVGAGGGAMSAVMARWLGPAGRVYATEVGDAQLAEIRAYVEQESLPNVVVLDSAESSTNLPAACCDAIFLRDVYHHLTRPAEINASLLAALKTGGRLAIVDFPPEPGSAIPRGVPNDRGGHGIAPSMIVTEVTRAGFRHVKTVSPLNAVRDRLFVVMFEKP